MLVDSVEKEVDIRGSKKIVFFNVYLCDWCGFDFDQMSRKSDTKKVVSSQVVCPRCSNFLRTWR